MSAPLTGFCHDILDMCLSIEVFGRLAFLSSELSASITSDLRNCRSLVLSIFKRLLSAARLSSCCETCDCFFLSSSLSGVIEEVRAGLTHVISTTRCRFKRPWSFSIFLDRSTNCPVLPDCFIAWTKLFQRVRSSLALRSSKAC